MSERLNPRQILSRLFHEQRAFGQADPDGDCGTACDDATTDALDALADNGWSVSNRPAGRAVQDDGLDVERLRKCPTLMVLLNRYGTFNEAWWDRLADEYAGAAPPLHDHAYDHRQDPPR